MYIITDASDFMVGLDKETIRLALLSCLWCFFRGVGGGSTEIGGVGRIHFLTVAEHFAVLLVSQLLRCG